MKVTIYGLRYQYVNIGGHGWNLLPGMYLDIDKDEAIELERIGACLIVKGDKNESDTADTKADASDSTRRRSGISDDAKKFSASRLVDRRHDDNADTEKRNRTNRKRSRKKTD